MIDCGILTQNLSERFQVVSLCWLKCNMPGASSSEFFNFISVDVPCSAFHLPYVCIRRRAAGRWTVISVVNANYLKLGNICVLVAIGLRPSEKIFLSM